MDKFMWQPTMGFIISLSADNGQKLWELKIDPTVEAVNGNVPSHITLGDEGIYMLGEEAVSFMPSKVHLIRPRMHLGQCSNRTAETVVMHMMKNPKAVQNQPILKWYL